MLDIKLIRKDKQRVEELLRRKDKSIDLDTILELDDRKRALATKIESLRFERNKESQKYSSVRREGEKDKGLEKHLKALRDKILSLEDDYRKVDARFTEQMSRLPNIPWDKSPVGGKEANKVIRTWGRKTEFEFKPKDHVALAKDLGIVDFDRAVKLSGSQFVAYVGDGARLEWALINFFLDRQRRRGYTQIIPPNIILQKTMYNSGQLPKFKDDVYFLERDNMYLIPTAESVLVSFHAGETLKYEELPKKYTAYTPCYRREAGGYRSGEKGLYRMHQFNKVECVRFVRKEDTYKANEEMVREAEELVESLGLHYRTSLLSTEDTSYSMHRTYDVEVYIPSLEGYGEVSSASTAFDYQARRSNTRYVDENGKKQYIHILNASGLATSRLMIALLECNQRQDGSVEIPEVLRPYMGGQKELKRS